MNEPLDVYVDQFTVTAGPYGGALTFDRNMPHPVPLALPRPERVATLRISVESLKVLAFVVARQIKAAEREMGVVYPIPAQVLSSLGIGPEDWEHFWKG